MNGESTQPDVEWIPEPNQYASCADDVWCGGCSGASSSLQYCLCPSPLRFFPIISDTQRVANSCTMKDGCVKDWANINTPCNFLLMGHFLILEMSFFSKNGQDTVYSCFCVVCRKTAANNCSYVHCAVFRLTLPRATLFFWGGDFFLSLSQQKRTDFGET